MWKFCVLCYLNRRKFVRCTALSQTTGDLYSVNTGDHEQLEPERKEVKALCREFEGAWESLIYDTNIKDRLVKHAQTSLHFASFGVDSNISECLIPVHFVSAKQLHSCHTAQTQNTVFH